MQDALMVALPAGLGGGVLAAATPEIAVAAKAAIQACAGNVVLCLNSAGIQVSEAIVPGGVGAGGAIGIGKTVTEATAAKAEAVAANTAKNVGNSTKGSLRGQFGYRKLLYVKMIFCTVMVRSKTEPNGLTLTEDNFLEILQVLL